MTQPAFRRVLVLTGDHRLPDTTKRDNAYHEEDFETHRAMRAALESLPGYSFEFLDDHGCFIDRFRSDPPEFVLNFCDTGFRNVSFLELNIPAYLELLGVPYSGATPQAMVIAYDKALVRLAAQAAGVPVPAETYLRPDDSLDLLPDRYPALIKPSHADGSVGITKDAVVHNRREALAYIAFLRDMLPDMIGEALVMMETGQVAEPSCTDTKTHALARTQPVLQPVAYASTHARACSYARTQLRTRAQFRTYADRASARRGRCRAPTRTPSLALHR